MKTRDWGRAQKEISGGNETGAVPGALLPKSKTVGEARDLYLADCAARNLSPLTIYNYGNTLRYLCDFLGADRPVAAVNLDDLTAFRAQLTAKLRGASVRGGNRQTERPLSVRGGIKVIKHLRAFYAFCLDHKLCTENYAKRLKAPKDAGPVTQPFTNDETQAIVGATEGPFEKALILAFLLTGFRISDVALLRRADINQIGSNTVIKVRKTGQNQYMKCHPKLAQALALVPRKGEFFFSETGLAIRTATERLRKTVRRVLKRAGISGHPHRFRDTFAVELLTKGVDIRTVQLLLGHSSVVTTELHYSPWVKAFQNRLDIAIMTLTYDESASNHTPAAERSQEPAWSGSLAS